MKIPSEIVFAGHLLQGELDVAGGTGEAVYTPSFVESRYH